jgi:hypothetical protein
MLSVRLAAAGHTGVESGELIWQVTLTATGKLGGYR